MRKTFIICSVSLLLAACSGNNEDVAELLEASPKSASKALTKEFYKYGQEQFDLLTKDGDNYNVEADEYGMDIKTAEKFYLAAATGVNLSEIPDEQLALEQFKDGISLKDIKALDIGTSYDQVVNFIGVECEEINLGQYRYTVTDSISITGQPSVILYNVKGLNVPKHRFGSVFSK